MKHKVRIIRSLYLLLLAAVLMAGLLAPAAQVQAASGADGTITVLYYNRSKTGMDGDAVLVQSGGRYLLMDTGFTDNRKDIANSSVIKYLKSKGIHNLDLYLSHYHNDHYFLMTTIMKDPYFTIGTVYLPNVDSLLPYTTEEYKNETWYKDLTKNISVGKSWEQHSYTEIQQTIKEKGLHAVTLSQGSTFQVGGAKCEVIWQHPEEVPGKALDTQRSAVALINRSSLVTRVTIGGVRYLTAGDIHKEVEREMIKNGVDLKADIVKTNHHSYTTSNLKEYYKAIDADWAFGTGTTNENILNVMNAVGTNYVSMQRNGVLTFTIRDGQVSMSGEKNLQTVKESYKDSAGNISERSFSFDKAQPYFVKGKMLPEGSVVIQHGWKTMGGKKYYYFDNVLQKGMTEVDGKHYFFDTESGAMRTGWIKDAEGRWFMAGSDGALKTGWYTESKKVKVSKKKYKTVKTKYYLDPETFVMATGFTEIDGKKYYFDPQSGAMATGTKTIDGRTYTFESTGEIRSGWRSVKKRVKISRKKYKTVTTWYYYLPEDGQAARGYLELEGKFYYFAQKDGAMQTGWITDTTDPAQERVYYAGTDGVLATGWKTISGKEYYFYPDAHKQLEGRAVVEGGECVFGKDGVLLARVYGSLAEVPATVNGYVGVGDALYYVKAGVPQTGWQTIEKKKHYFDPADSGAMARGRFVIEGKAYWFDPADGILHTNGWFTSPEGQKYSADKNGVLRSGWYEQKVSKKVKKKYYLDPATNAAAMGVTEIGGKRYFFDEKTGELKKSAWCKTTEGTWYRTDGSGVLKTDWYKESKRVKIKKKKYKTVTTWYYLDRESGEMATGFREIDGKYYYFDETNGAMATGTKTIDGVQYTFASSGALQGEPPAEVNPALAMEPVTETTTETVTETVTEAATVTTTEAATVTTTEAAAVTTTQPAEETDKAAETAAEPSTQGTTEVPAGADEGNAGE